MKTKSIYVLSLTLGIFVLGGCSLTGSYSKPVDEKNNVQASKQTATTTLQTFTMDEVAQANSANKCWTVVNGSVYDLTSFVNKHKGGAKNVLDTCGIDSTSIYEDQHGGQKKPENVLSSLLIGKLKQ